MIKWVDIVSPRLRQLYGTWVDQRGPRLMVHLRDYNSFVGHVPADGSLSVILPINRSGAAVKHAGNSVAESFPGLQTGVRLTDVTSPLIRSQVAVFVREVASNRQPDCRRGLIRFQNRTRNYEQLLLPFDNDQLQVCLVHAIYEFGPLERVAA